MLSRFIPSPFTSYWFMLALAGILGSAISGAQATEKTDKEDKKTTAKAESSLAVTTHHIEIDGNRDGPIHYEAQAGWLPLTDDAGKNRARVFFVSYTRQHVDDASRRPVTFVFNGGPGSSSVWLHMGFAGPYRVSMNGDRPVPPPGKPLIPNGHSILDLTDLVMIDPVSTGYSRAAEGEDAKQFHGYSEDIESVGDFIWKYVTTRNRWNSPKFLLGESYGTTRAAGMVGYLQDRHGMYFNGIGMVSSVLDFQTILFNENNDLPYILFLPSYTATAWYHGELDEELQQDLQKALEEAEAFAEGDYARALFQGDRLSADDQQKVAEELARLTGLSPEFVQASNLRVTMGRFGKELLRDQRRTVGRLDSRFQGIDRDAAGERYEYDPSNAVIHGPYTAAFNHYVRNRLNFKADQTYEILTSKVHPWNYGKFKNRYVDSGETLREAMTVNPALKVFVASGYYDLATPYFASKYTYSHLQLEPHLRENIRFGHYEAGHMMYIHEPSLVQLKRDITEFYEWASSDPAATDASQ